MGWQAEELCRQVEEIGRSGTDAQLATLAPLLASTAWYDANGGDVYGGQYPVSVAETAAGVLVERGAVGLLLDALRGPEARARAVAAGALGHTGGDEVIAALEAALADEEEVAVAAGLSLGRLLKGSARLEQLVTRALVGPGRERGALAAAVELDWGATERLADLWYPLLERWELYAFQRVRDLPALDERTWAWLAERAGGTTGQRAQAVRLLRDWLNHRRQGVERFVGLYRQLMDDPEAWVRDEARRVVPWVVRREGA